MAFATISVCGLDYSFTMERCSLGVSCLVSAPSSFQRLGSRLPSAFPVMVSLNLRHSTSLFSESALNCAMLTSRMHQWPILCQRGSKNREKPENRCRVDNQKCLEGRFLVNVAGVHNATLSNNSHKSLVSTIPPPRRNVGMQRYAK